MYVVEVVGLHYPLAVPAPSRETAECLVRWYQKEYRDVRTRIVEVATDEAAVA